MVNQRDNIIAFDASLTNVLGKYEKEYFNGGVVVRIEEERTLELLKLISNEGVSGNYASRLIYIDDVLYYINDESIRAFNIETFEEIIK